MKVSYTENCTEHNQMYDNVCIPKYLMAQLVDYFIFCRDEEKLKFNGFGELKYVEGVPMEIMNIIKQMVTVTQKPKTYQIDMKFQITTYETEDELYNRIVMEAPNTAQKIAVDISNATED